MSIKTEDIILRVAQKHFVQKGFAGAKMQEIADEAKINKALLHYYFRSKDKLYDAVVHSTLDAFIPRLLKAFEDQGDIWKSIQRIVDTYIDLLIEMPHVPLFIMYELSQKQEAFIDFLRKRMTLIPTIGQFIQRLLQAMQDGVIREFQAQHLLLNILGLTVFPFMAKPIFCTAFNYTDNEFSDLMLERKAIIMDFLQIALNPKQVQ